MRYPSFFADVPPLVMKDRLAEFLGAAEDGLVEYRYVDAVKLAGHSCPTVATAWVLTTRALKALYGDDVPERGEVRVQMRDPRAAGVTGVVANVASLLTGAAADTGFKGIAGRFDRRDLLSYGEPLPMEVRFTRIDTGSAVDAGANLATIPADPELAPLLRRCAAQAATQDEQARFRELWQDRVRRVLEHAEDPEVFAISRVS